MEGFFVERAAIGIKEHRAGFYFGNRVEKWVRRLALREVNPDCSVLKKLYGYADPRGGVGHLTVRTPAGERALYFRPRTSDEDVIRDIFHTSHYSLEKLPRWSEIAKLLEDRHRAGRRPLIIDAGANIGASAVFFATTFPTATIVAIEPELGNFNLLRKNTQGLNVTCVRAALASEAGVFEVLDPGGGPWAFRTQRVDRGDGLPSTTIGSIFERHLDESSFPFIVKIDIEGGEEDVFTRNTGWFEETPVLIIELHDWMLPGKGSALPFLRCVSALDRDFLYSGENVFSIDNAISGGSATATLGAHALEVHAPN
jgi:FkbM family methyltransferase